jgi:hypothetical protein
LISFQELPQYSAVSHERKIGPSGKVYKSDDSEFNSEKTIERAVERKSASRQLNFDGKVEATADLPPISSNSRPSVAEESLKSAKSLPKPPPKNRNSAEVASSSLINSSNSNQVATNSSLPSRTTITSTSDILGSPEVKKTVLKRGRLLVNGRPAICELLDSLEFVWQPDGDVPPPLPFFYPFTFSL